jgi:hypothetical protein
MVSMVSVVDCLWSITKEVLSTILFLRVQAKVQPSCHFEKSKINFNGYIHREWKRVVGNVVVVLSFMGWRV